MTLKTTAQIISVAAVLGLFMVFWDVYGFVLWWLNPEMEEYQTIGEFVKDLMYHVSNFTLMSAIAYFFYGFSRKVKK
jgi:hypothetical protein